MIVLQPEHLPSFVDELRGLFPHSILIYMLARNCSENQQFSWPGVEFVTDQFPNFNACIVRPSPTLTKHVPRQNHPTYNVCAKTPEALKSLLEEDNVVDWSKPAFFAAVWEPLAKTIYGVIQQHGVAVGPQERGDFRAFGVLFHSNKLTPSPTIPDGFTVKELEREDIEQVNSIWHFGKTPQCREFLMYLYDHKFPNIGIFNPERQLVGYEMCSAEMCMFAAYIHPEYRNRKFFNILTTAFCKKIFSLGLDFAYAFVSEPNVASHTSMYRAGGERAENFDVNWFVYTPNNFTDRSDPLLQWLDNLSGLVVWQT